MAKSTLTKTDLKNIGETIGSSLAEAVAKVIAPQLQPAPAPQAEPQVIISDELKGLLEVKDQLVRQLPNPVMLKIVGTRGTTLVNQTVEMLNTVDEQIKGYKSFGTRVKVK
tara:strand:+ start:404 stop:736 length:333 start_codon:yes stop_codon:yes gene_type:complete